MSNQENDKLIEHAYQLASERGHVLYIDDGLVQFDLEGAVHYLETGEFLDAHIINQQR